MSARRVFVVTGLGLAVHHRHGRTLLDPFSFDSDDAGFAQFARYLERFPGDVACVVADVVEEEFREETVPHVLGRERRALLRAKADRAFRGVRHVHATILGREPEGRRDDRVLFSALTRPAVFSPWIAAMARYKVPLAGIWSPAMLTGWLLKAVDARGDHVLVVSKQSGGGLRQTYFRHGRLRLSRLAAMPAPSAGGFGLEVLAEVKSTLRYLRGLSGSPQDLRPEVRVLSHGEPLEDLRRELRGDTGRDLRTGCVVLDLADVARRLGMRRWGGEATADRLFVHVLARRPPRNHYATEEETSGHASLRVRSLLRTASAGAALVGCLFAGASFLEGVIASGFARTLAVQSTLYESRYREAESRLPPSPAEPAELERAVSAVNTLRARRADPVDALALVSHAVAGFPRVRIERLSWRTSDDPEAPVGDGAAAEDVARGEPSTSGGTPPRDPDILFQLVLVGARIAPFDGDYRAAITTVRRFASALAASPGIEHVRVRSLPLDLSSDRSVSGDTESSDGDATFEIRVGLRAGVPVRAEARDGA